MELFQNIIGNTTTSLIKSDEIDTKAVQSTILILIDRLENSNLVSDRKASIQSLKSFSRENREFIIENGIKQILNTLKKDAESSDMIQLVLETLLNLLLRTTNISINKDFKMVYQSKKNHKRLQYGKYPSPIVLNEDFNDIFDDFSIWITDEFLKMKKFSLQLLIDTLNSDTEQNFYLKFYCILTLEAVFSIRPELAIEDLIQIPTSLNTLINLLDDENVQIKNETLLLLISLVDNESKIGYDTTHLKSLIVFEGIFSKLFDIILKDNEDAIVKNDCFVLINNLIKYNTMNQRIFIEDKSCLENIIQVLLKYLNSSFQWVVNSDTQEDLEMLSNIILIINSLVEEDTDITAENQNHLFNNSNVGMILLQLSFKPGV